MLIILQLSFADGTVYAGQFSEGLFHGLGVLSFSDKVRAIYSMCADVFVSPSTKANSLMGNITDLEFSPSLTASNSRASSVTER
jgi:hypothetical protein